MSDEYERDGARFHHARQVRDRLMRRLARDGHQSALRHGASLDDLIALAEGRPLAAERMNALADAIEGPPRQPADPLSAAPQPPTAAPPPRPARHPALAELDATREELAAAQAALADEHERALRLRADLDNVQRRQRDDRDQAVSLERGRMLSELAEVLDTVQLALSVSEDPSSMWHQGMVGIRAQVEAVLRRNGAEPVGAIGDRFDPAVHEAIDVRPDAVPPDHLAEVVQQGWRFTATGRLVRAARVVVSSGQPQ